MARWRRASRISQKERPRVDSPPSRWATTISGLTSSVTVHMPSRPWTITVPSRMSGSTTGCFGSRRLASARPAMQHDDEAERRGHVAMDHLVPGFARVERPVRERPRRPRRARAPRRAPSAGRNNPASPGSQAPRPSGGPRRRARPRSAPALPRRRAVFDTRRTCVARPRGLGDRCVG